MNRLIAAHAPAAVVGNTVFISVELWEQGVVVHIARVPTPETERLTAEFEAALNAWREGDEFLEAPDAALELAL